MSNRNMLHVLMPCGLDKFDSNRNPAVDYLTLSFFEFDTVCKISSRFWFQCQPEDDDFGGGNHIHLKRSLQRALGQDVKASLKAAPVSLRPEPAYVDPRGRNAGFVVQPRDTTASAVPKLPKKDKLLLERVIKFIDEKCRLGFVIERRMFV